jgi:hypothetical protein
LGKNLRNVASSRNKAKTVIIVLSSIVLEVLIPAEENIFLESSVVPFEKDE